MSIGNKTSTVTINAAFLQEIKEVNSELWQLLEKVGHLCSTAHQIEHQGRHVVDMLGALRDQLALHFTLEEAYGYFDDPVHVAPRLCLAATALRDEHELLYARISRLADEVDELQRSGRLAKSGDHIVARFREFSELFQQHESRESELILEAYDSDIGVGD